MFRHVFNKNLPFHLPLGHRINLNSLKRYSSQPPPNAPIQKSQALTELLKISKLAIRERKPLAGACSLLLISSIVSMSVPFSMGRIIDIVMSTLGVHTVLATTESTTTLMSDIPLPYLFSGLLGVFFIGACANTGRLILFRLAGERIVMRLKSDIFANLLRQDMSFFDKNRTGELISRLSLDTTVVGKTITNNISDGLRAFLQTSIGIGAMMYVNTNLTLIMMSIVPPVSLAAIWYGRIVRDLSTKTQDALGETSKVAEEKLSNIKTVRAFAQEDGENKTYINRVRDVYSLAKNEAFATGLFYGFTGLAGNSVILALLYYGGSMVRDGLLSIGDLTSFFLYTVTVFNFRRMLAELLWDYQVSIQN